MKDYGEFKVNLSYLVTSYLKKQTSQPNKQRTGSNKKNLKRHNGGSAGKNTGWPSKGQTQNYWEQGVTPFSALSTTHIQPLKSFCKGLFGAKVGNHLFKKYNSHIYAYTHTHNINPGLVACTYNLRIWEVEAEDSPKVHGQPGLQVRPCVKKQTIEEMKLQLCCGPLWWQHCPLEIDWS